ncbi:MAG TPA: acyltransferase [Capsulimonadaceae bacterium]|nr:acyltransferase [Capsulimonadaceae bacterium]
MRLDAIDGLRAIAALWVLGYHMWVRFLPGLIATHSDHGWWLWPLGWCRYGRFAVDFFIVISGFCLMLPVVSSGELRGGVASFWKKRARRILPTYYAAILATLPLCWLFVDWSRWFVTLKGLLLHAILLQDVFGNNEISSVYWSIAVECHIYLLFPLLVLLCRRVGPAWTFLLGSALGTALFWLLKGTPYVGSTPQYLILFSMGMLAANLCRRPGEGIKNALAVFFCAALLVLCGSGWVDRMQGVLGSTAPLALDSFVGLCAALVVLAAAQPAGLTARLLGGRPLVLIGGFSYSLYLIHAPIHFICFKTIWVLMQHRIPAEIAYPLFVLMTVPIVLAGALAFHLLFEAPFLSAGSGGELERLTGGLRAQSPLLAGVDRMLGRWMRPAHAPNPGPATQS